MQLADMQRHDENITAVEVLQAGDDYKVIKQTNKLPWPIWNRQTLVRPAHVPRVPHTPVRTEALPETR